MSGRITDMPHRNSRILIADDEPQVLKLFTRLLTRGGYDVTAVQSGSDAEKVLEQEAIDLLVLDLSMPEPDGFDMLKTLKRKRPGLRILVISGYLQGALLHAAEILGATASLDKRKAPQLLLKTVDSLLQ
jgi:CheY-like chemotaxis protein